MTAIYHLAHSAGFNSDSGYLACLVDFTGLKTSYFLFAFASLII